MCLIQIFFSSKEIILFSSIILVLSGSNFSLFFTDGVSQFTGSGKDYRKNKRKNKIRSPLPLCDF